VHRGIHIATIDRTSTVQKQQKTSDEHIMSCLEYPRQLQKEDGGLTIRTMTNKMVCNGTKCLPSNSAILSRVDNPAIVYMCFVLVFFHSNVSFVPSPPTPTCMMTIDEELINYYTESITIVFIGKENVI
jgi:hypothetical protein